MCNCPGAFLAQLPVIRTEETQKHGGQRKDPVVPQALDPVSLGFFELRAEDEIPGIVVLKIFVPDCPLSVRLFLLWDLFSIVRQVMKNAVQRNPGKNSADPSEQASHPPPRRFRFGSEALGFTCSS